MRVATFMFICIYCFLQIESVEMPTPSSMHVPEEEELEESVSAARGRVLLYPPPLVSPYGGTIKLVLGIAVPIIVRSGRTLSFGQNFQFQYAIPQNASFFTNYFDDFKSQRRSGRMTAASTERQRKNRNTIMKPDNTRSIFYRSLELAYERWGGNGKSCVLRSICEAAETTLEGEGLVGELLHVMLTPNYGAGADLDTSDDGDYHQAAKAGTRRDNCSLIYPGCPEGAGLLDRVSLLDYI